MAGSCLAHAWACAWAFCKGPGAAAGVPFKIKLMGRLPTHMHGRTERKRAAAVHAETGLKGS